MGLYEHIGAVLSRIRKKSLEGLRGDANAKRPGVNFASPGLYEYDGGWKKINFNNCETMSAVNLD